MTDARCGCTLLAPPSTPESPCTNPATQEDLLCDACRAGKTGGPGTMHVGPAVGTSGPHTTLTGISMKLVFR